MQLEAATWSSRQWDLNGRVLCHFQTHCLNGIDLLGKVPVCSSALPSLCCPERGCSGRSSGYHLGPWQDESCARRVGGLKDQDDGDFPDSPVVKTSCSQCREHRFSQGTKFLHAAWHSQKKAKEGRKTDQTESDGIVQFSSVAQSCFILCDPMNRNMPGLPVHYQLLKFTQTHVHWVSDAIQPSHPLLSPSPPALSLSQHQGLFKWVSSLHQVAKILEFQLQHQSFQWTPRTDL